MQRTANELHLSVDALVVPVCPLRAYISQCCSLRRVSVVCIRASHCFLQIIFSKERQAAATHAASISWTLEDIGCSLRSMTRTMSATYPETPKPFN